MRQNKKKKFNWNLKIAFLKMGYPTAASVAEGLRLEPTRFNRILNGRVSPTPEQRRVIEARFGKGIV